MVACIGFIQMIVVITNKYFVRMNENSRGFSSLSEITIYVLATLTNHGNEK